MQVLPATPLDVPGVSVAVRYGPGINYQLQPKDTVHIRVFGEDDLETTAHIDKDGDIAFPLLGLARIGGQTIQQATTTMETLLRKYLVHPQVFVDIAAYSKQRFTMLGQVAKPGTYDMPDETQLDLLEAIGMAGGYSKIANPSKITVKRIVDGKETLIKIDGKKMLRGKDTFSFQVEPGDTIDVGEALF